MKVTLLCSDALHPINTHIKNWIIRKQMEHEISFVTKMNDVPGGDVLFLVSCSEIASLEHRSLYKHCLVLHASDLPRGRGWSPHIWQIIEGAQNITVTLLEADDHVDSGRIWKQKVIHIEKHALWDEINNLLFDAELELIDYAVSNYSNVSPRPQNNEVQPTYYLKRNPKDSEIDPNKSIASQFDLIRVCDPTRFPAFFELYGKKFKLTVEKIDD